MKVSIFNLILVTIFFGFGITAMLSDNPPVFAKDSLREQKMQVIDPLKIQIENCITQQTSDDLEMALNLIQKGLKPKFWDDDGNNIIKPYGDKFFNNDKKAVQILLKVIHSNLESQEFDSELVEIIKKIVQIDKKIANQSLTIINGFEPSIYSDKIEKANQKFTKANKELEKENFVKAIKLYYKIWNYAAKNFDPMFVDVTEKSGIQFEHYRSMGMMPIGGGTALIDFNNDGLLDIYITNSAGPNALYRNNGNMIFENIAAKAGVEDLSGKGNGVCFADYNNDGNTDFFLTTFGTSKLFSNNGDETFTDITLKAGVADPNIEFRSMGCTWGDYNQDGFLDLIVVRHFSEFQVQFGFIFKIPNSLKPLSLFTNNGDGTFSNDTIFLGDPEEKISNLRGVSFQPSFVDYDNDGDLDIYVVNDFGAIVQPNVLWENIGPGDGSNWIFKDVSKSSGSDIGISGMGIAVGDYDSNGFLDFYVTNIGKNILLKNENGKFVDVSDQAGVSRPTIYENDISVTWGTMFFDYDNDGFLDIYLVAGHLDVFPSTLKQPNALFKNNGDGTFSDVSIISDTDDDGFGRGGAFGDFNNDGCLDIFVVNVGMKDGTPGKPKLFENACQDQNNWIIIKTIGNKSNHEGIGTRITLTTSHGEQIREVSSGSSQMSQNMLPVHFGLADSMDIYISIQWPSGIEQTLTNIHPNQILTITEPN